jgi:hypothetical protein
MKHIIILLLLTISSWSFAQNKPLKILEYYIYGKDAFGLPATDCILAIEAKYGYKIVSVGGCVVKARKVVVWNRHNRKVKRKMARRFGDDWQTAYREDLKKCEV